MTLVQFNPEINLAVKKPRKQWIGMLQGRQRTIHSGPSLEKESALLKRQALQTPTEVQSEVWKEWERGWGGTELKRPSQTQQQLSALHTHIHTQSRVCETHSGSWGLYCYRLEVNRDAIEVQRAGECHLNSNHFTWVKWLKKEKRQKKNKNQEGVSLWSASQKVRVRECGRYDKYIMILDDICIVI